MNALAGIPHLPRTPLVGHTLDFLRDPYGLHARSRARLGPVYRIDLLGDWRVTLGGADALGFILGDRDKLFSSAGGWDVLSGLFPGGLMLRDFDDHRAHRRLMQTAFRKPALDAYRDAMGAAMGTLLERWPLDRPFRFYPAIKALTLQMGAQVFMGLPLDDARAGALNSAFAAEVAASVGVIRKPWPGTKMRRGTRARRVLIDTFREMIPARRAAPGPDFFSQMCVATDQDGTGWSAEEIADHFNFLLMAAHDTTAASLSKVVWALAAYPDWQVRVRDEVAALDGGPLDDAALASMEVTDRVFREALRLLPPVPFIPRQAVRDFEWEGRTYPAGTYVSALPGPVMRDPAFWPEPERFDPDRFAPGRAEDRAHPYAWAPFGGGAHKCIGLHFATLQVKLFVALLMRRARVTPAVALPTRWAAVPIPKPRDGLPIVLRART
ncbi:MAG: cytochrome P450 [Pseudomonadota bacterium]